VQAPASGKAALEPLSRPSTTLPACDSGGEEKTNCKRPPDVIPSPREARAGRGQRKRGSFQDPPPRPSSIRHGGARERRPIDIKPDATASRPYHSKINISASFPVVRGKRQRTAALHEAGAHSDTPSLRAKRLGVRQPPAALDHAGCASPHPGKIRGLQAGQLTALRARRPNAT